MILVGSDLFNAKTIERLVANISISKEQEKASQEWLELLKQNKLNDEKHNYFKFAKLILEILLGYDISKDLEHESGNVEFPFRDLNGKYIVAFEVKGYSTKDLFSLQYNRKKEHETPIKQTWDYMGGVLNLDYGVCTNYRDFVLLDRTKGYAKCYKFDFLDIEKNPNKLKEFIAIFSKDTFFNKKFLEELYEKSEMEQREFTSEFYKLFHETRLMLVKEFQNNGIAKEQAIHNAQLFLNRLMFVFFAEDTDRLQSRLFESQILNILKSGMLFSEDSSYVCDSIRNLFNYLDVGSEQMKIFGFNGGLFREKISRDIFFKDLQKKYYFKDIELNSKLKKRILLNESINEFFTKFDINPIIKNLFIMASFDFNTELNVNILGHIFEQSLNDIEEINGSQVSKRKKDGIFYTPEYITDYICRNTIIPYLSNKGVNNVDDLITEYYDSVGLLEEKFKNIKILDPACGSGAFLIKAVDVLLEIHKRIIDLKELKGNFETNIKISKNQKEKHLSLVKWSEESAVRDIILNNIYGVDLNEESVEITKLSLFLKMAKRDQKLVNLSSNIKCGNSLIDDSEVAGDKAFNWQQNFPNIFANGGFDVIIGNPPYVKEFISTKPFEEIKKSNSWIKEFYEGKMDLWYFFVSLGINLLKINGNISYIAPNNWITNAGAKKMRNNLLKNLQIRKYIDFNNYKNFEEAGIQTMIFILNKNTNSNYNLRYKKVNNENNENKIVDFLNSEQNFINIEFNNSNFFDKDINFSYGNTSNVLQHILTNKNFVLTKDEIINGIHPHYDFVNKRILEEHMSEDIKIGEGIFGLSHNEKNNCNFLPNELKIIKPYYTTEELHRYFAEDKNKLWIIYAKSDMNSKIESYPNIKKHLDKFSNVITSDNKPYGLHRARKEDFFVGEKIIARRKCDEQPIFTFSDQDCYVSATFYLIKSQRINMKYLITLFNSKLIAFWLKNMGKMQGNNYQLDKDPLLNIPIKQISLEQQKPFIEKADLMLSLNKELYEKSNKFLQRLKDNLHLEKVSKKLDNFYDLNFAEFSNELKKQKIELKLKEQDEWQDYFETYKKELIELKQKIDLTDNEIDQMVYKLYGLTPEEIRIVEESLK